MRSKPATPRDDAARIIARHLQVRWIHPGIITLGAWLIVGPAALGEHGSMLVLMDLISGASLVALGSSFTARRGWTPWAAALVGVWLLLAPVIFWAPSAPAYASNTLIGTLVIALSVVLPYSMATPGPEIPHRWSHNPSAWLRRLPVIALALVGFASVSYVAAYELGYIRSFRALLFADDIRRIIDSEASRFPASVAGLTAVLLLLAALMGALGDSRRWRTMPFIVALSCVLVFTLGIASTLVIWGSIADNMRCTVCSLASAAVLVIVLLCVGELAATIQFVIESRRAGASTWRTFWRGEKALC